MILLYRLGILFYSVIALLISPFSSKAKLIVRGRRNSFRIIKDKLRQGDRFVWMHCASLGEFEQGRPLIEAIRKEYPEFRILLTFFSPSGYEIRKNYPGADIVCYLPSDRERNAVKLLDTVKPELVLFVKYEYWNYYLKSVADRGIPLLLVSALFRKDQIFFRWYGGFFRKILERYSHIFVQDEGSAERLESLGITNVTISGDTRFDRVMEIAAVAKSIPQIESFRGNEKLFLAGSSWKPDEEIIARYINDNPGRMKWVFAPHETDSANIERLVKLFRVKCVRFSEYNDGEKDAGVMVIDNVGMLSSAYRYAFIAAVGGGFGRGIHNILEAATWGVPVLFGPNHEKFREALSLIYLGGAKSFRNYDEFKSVLEDLSDNPTFYERSALAASEYIRENAGATKKIMEWISREVINNT